MIYVVLYLLSIVLANLSVVIFGPSVVVVNAFLLIGLDLTLRDKLHESWSGKNLALKMGLLILAGSVISYLLNAEAARIAIASFVAFLSTGIVDTFVYQRLFDRPLLVKMNGSNVLSALVDSVLFVTIAFGIFLPVLIVGQVIAKIGGGFFWSLFIRRFIK